MQWTLRSTHSVPSLPLAPGPPVPLPHAGPSRGCRPSPSGAGSAPTWLGSAGPTLLAAAGSFWSSDAHRGCPATHLNSRCKNIAIWTVQTPALGMNHVSPQTRTELLPSYARFSYFCLFSGLSVAAHPKQDVLQCHKAFSSSSIAQSTLKFTELFSPVSHFYIASFRRFWEMIVSLLRGRKLSSLHLFLLNLKILQKNKRYKL